MRSLMQIRRSKAASQVEKRPEVQEREKLQVLYRKERADDVRVLNFSKRFAKLISFSI